jgi:hypothetical protein
MLAMMGGGPDDMAGGESGPDDMASSESGRAT